MPKTVLVGLAETAVKESTHRVERAIVNSGYKRAIDRVVIKLAPADLKKDAGGFDLPIALGLLLGSGQVSSDRPGTFAVVGELALTGETRPIKGALALALEAATEKRTGLLVPAANAQEAAVVEAINVYPVGSLAEAVGFLSGQVDMNLEAVDLDEVFKQLSHLGYDFVDVKGQDYAKQTRLIVAAGGHNVLTLQPNKPQIVVGWSLKRKGVFVNGKANSGMVGPSFCSWAVGVAVSYCGHWCDSLRGDSLWRERRRCFLHVTGVVARCVSRQENMEGLSFLTPRSSRERADRIPPKYLIR
jgi:Subunit ChlI of Mg-chelatase